MKLPVYLLLLTFPLSGLAQPSNPFALAAPSSEIRLSYVGTIVYPGLKLGIAIPVKQITLAKQGGKKYRLKDRHLVLNLSGYHHPDFHDNLYLTAEWQMRRTKPSGWFTEFSPGLGYSRTFLGGTTYRVADNGEVSIKRAAGYGYFLATVGGGLGYDFSVRQTRPITAFFRANVLVMLPYNSFLYVRPTVELGLTYKLPAISLIKPRTKTIQK